MYKAIGFWTWPRDEDMAEFEEHYAATHYPLATKLPGLLRVTVMRANDNGRESGIYRVAECFWADRAAYERAVQSPEWAAMASDAAYLIDRFGVELKSADGIEMAE